LLQSIGVGDSVLTCFQPSHIRFPLSALTHHWTHADTGSGYVQVCYRVKCGTGSVSKSKTHVSNSYPLKPALIHIQSTVYCSGSKSIQSKANLTLDIQDPMDLMRTGCVGSARLNLSRRRRRSLAGEALHSWPASPPAGRAEPTREPRTGGLLRATRLRCGGRGPWS
jgi:hypothetical protein